MTNGNIDAVMYPEMEAGGFTRFDGTVQFYTRVNALLTSSMTLVDLGAGRGAFLEGESPYRRSLCTLKGKVDRVIGIDVDDAVRDNPNLDEAHVYDGNSIPLPDASVDLVVSDWTFEHVADPTALASEITRILKPGGWVCARTPHLFSLLVAASCLIPNKKHVSILNSAQPGRQARDVFPTTYKLNTAAALLRVFPNTSWQHYSYTWSAEPAYHFNSSIIYRLISAYQYVKRPLLGGECLFIFMRKRAAAT